MRRSQRIAATASATASLLVGAGFALAAVPGAAPAVAHVTQPTPTSADRPELDRLSSSAEQLRAESDALASALAAARLASTDRAPTTTAPTQPGEPAASEPASPTGSARTDPITRAGGLGGEDEQADDHEHDDDHGPAGFDD
jgi:hypothetical protein